MEIVIITLKIIGYILSGLYLIDLIVYSVKKVRLMNYFISDACLAGIVILGLVRVGLEMQINIYQAIMLFVMIASLIYVIYRKYIK